MLAVNSRMKRSIFRLVGERISCERVMLQM